MGKTREKQVKKGRKEERRNKEDKKERRKEKWIKGKYKRKKITKKGGLFLIISSLGKRKTRKLLQQHFAPAKFNHCFFFYLFIFLLFWLVWSF